jgi:hypothetical protein
MEWLIVGWMGVGVLCGFLAPARGRDGAQWLVLGVLFSIFAAVALLVLPKQKTGLQTAGLIPPRRTMDDIIQEILARRTSWLKSCPACDQLIATYDRQCQHCGHHLAADGVQSQS